LILSRRLNVHVAIKTTERPSWFLAVTQGRHHHMFK
jgi:hypothetical protein